MQPTKHVHACVTFAKGGGRTQPQFHLAACRAFPGLVGLSPRHPRSIDAKTPVA
jgi:hypothetical protein